MTARRLAALAVAAVMAALAMVLVGAPPALACSCAATGDQRADDAAAFERADVVFTGRAIERREPPRAALRSSGDPATYVFVVEAVHKGTAQRLQEVVTAVSGASCGLEATVGPTYVVFAERQGRELDANLCGGTRPADPPLGLGGSQPPHGAVPASAPEGGEGFNVAAPLRGDGAPLGAVVAAAGLVLATAAGTALAFARRSA